MPTTTTTILGIDIGSSSVKAAVLRGGKILGRVGRREFPTTYDGVRAEVQPREIWSALAASLRDVGARAKRVDVIALATMSPAWVAMDRKGEPLTPIVTHQDRRSVEVAREIEARVGKRRHLRLAGNRPFPGGISSTTFAWFLKHDRARMRKAALVGHLNTYLHRQITGARVIDPSNASFTGLYSTLTLRGWNDELCENIGVRADVLPDVKPADAIGGHVRAGAARALGLRAGTPMLVGLTDGSSTMLLAGAKPGQLVNVSGSTDVLALCTDKPRPHERLLTRALGVGRRWLSVSTLAAVGSTLTWTKEQLFPDLAWPQYKRLMKRLGSGTLDARDSRNARGTRVVFDPYLAGDRTSIEQPTGAFRGLTLSTTREDMLGAVVDALATASAERLDLLKINPARMNRRVVVSGGVSDGTADLMHRDWPGRWSFHVEPDATLRGLAKLAESTE